MVRIHNVDLYNLISNQKPETAIVCEASANTELTISRIWPGFVTDQVMRDNSCFTLPRVGATVRTNLGVKLKFIRK